MFRISCHVAPDDLIDKHNRDGSCKGNEQLAIFREDVQSSYSQARAMHIQILSNCLMLNAQEPCHSLQCRIARIPTDIVSDWQTRL